MNLKKKILIITGVIQILIVLIICIAFINWRNKFSNPLIPQIKNSLVLEEKIGKVKSVKIMPFSFPKVVDNKGRLTYTVKTDRGKYKVTTIIDMIGYDYIAVGYIINGEEIQENTVIK